MAIVRYQDLPRIRIEHKDKRIVFTSGSFDLVHAGHAHYLEACKALGDILVVAVGKADDIKKRKGDDRPVLNDYARIKMIDSLKPVAYTFFSDSPEPQNHPISILLDIFSSLRPDMYVLNYDANDLPLHQQQCDQAGVQFVRLQLDRDRHPELENISTTAIIEKIKKLRD